MGNDAHYGAAEKLVGKTLRPTENCEVRINAVTYNNKASEVYLDCTYAFSNPKIARQWWIPIVYRTGVDFAGAECDDLIHHLAFVATHGDPRNWEAWKEGEFLHWSETRPGSKETFEIFSALVRADFEWISVKDALPGNSNPARRYQTLKDDGYYIPVDASASRRTGGTRLLLLPIPKGNPVTYETWPPRLRDEIIAVHESRDAYDLRVKPGGSLIPDHKFPEIRWDGETKRESLAHLGEEDIRNDFQLVTNQINQTKREVCRKCYQTNLRGFPFGIEFWYQGGREWPKDVPLIGKAAEQGCVGCGWYDLAAWRNALNAKLAASD